MGHFTSSLDSTVPALELGKFAFFDPSLEALPLSFSTINRSSSGMDSIHILRCLFKSDVIDLPQIGQSLGLQELILLADDPDGAESAEFTDDVISSTSPCTGISSIESSKTMTEF
jgi:hypothetical protein